MLLTAQHRGPLLSTLLLALTLLTTLLTLPIAAHPTATPQERGPITAPLAKSYTNLIISDISNIDKAVRRLTAFVVSYDGSGGVLGASPLFTGVTEIHTVNRKGFVDALPPFKGNDEESERIVSFTEQSVGVSIPESVDALVDKKPEILGAGVSPELVVGGLKLLQDDHDSYSALLLKKVSPPFLPRAQAVVDDIHDAIQVGIDVYEAA